MPRKRKPQPRATEIDKLVGRNVRERRKTLGISQEALAKPLGCTSQQLQKYEAGTNRIATDRLWKLSGLLGWRLELFFEGAPTPPERLA